MKQLLFLAVLLLLSGCAPGEVSFPPPPPPESSSVQSSQPEQSSAAPAGQPEDEEEWAAKELLCREMARRGMGEYDSAKLVPYDGNINGCFSYTENRRTLDRDEILVYRYDTAPGNYDILAISKDRQIFFLMSQVDGVLNDIRDSYAYVHDGEYTKEEAQAELERYLRAETDIDPGEYDIVTDVGWIDGDANYLVCLDQKGAAPGDGHAYEFYISKDLRRIARIEYRDEPVTRYERIGEFALEPDFPPSTDIYTQEEAAAVLLGWIRQNLLPQAEAEDVRLDHMYRYEMPAYVFHVPAGDGTDYAFFVTATLEHVSYDRIVPTEEMLPQKYFVYLRDKK